MACGCSDNSCSCVLTGGTNVTVSGGGTAGNPFVINSTSAAAETNWTGTNTDGGIAVTPGGTDGHAPLINLNLDPDSPASLSVSVSGLSVECCPQTPEAVFAPIADDGILILPGGLDGHSPEFGLVLDPASPAALSVSPDGLSVACCASEEPFANIVQILESDYHAVTIGDGTTGGDTPTDLSPSFTLINDGTKKHYVDFSSANLDMSTGDPALSNLGGFLTLIDQSGPTAIASSISQTFMDRSGSDTYETTQPILSRFPIASFTGTKSFNFTWSGFAATGVTEFISAFGPASGIGPAIIVTIVETGA